MNELDGIARDLVEGDARGVSRRVAAALDAGIAPEEILEEGLVAGMAVVGRRFRENEIFVPEVLVSARAMKAGLGHLEPILAESGIEPFGTCVLGTVRGDIHDIGKNLVGVMLRGAGFRVVDLGVDVPPERFVEGARGHRADLVGISALLTTTMPGMEGAIRALRDAGVEAPVLVGGAPVTPEFAREVGADGYAGNAADAADRALELLDAGGPADGGSRVRTADPDDGPGGRAGGRPGAGSPGPGPEDG